MLKFNYFLFRLIHEKEISEKKQEVGKYNDQINSIREKVIMLQTIIAILKVKKSLSSVFHFLN